MCGIAGQFKFEGVADRELIERMTRLFSYRGPDGEGHYYSGSFGMGMRRLKIIDLSTGDQPIYNEDKSVAVVFNGEIYNYRRLRKELEDSGHKFYTRSDTEVIAHLYEEKGEDFAKDLRGMFAIAVWDDEKRKLILVRDRAGEKPLYIYQGSNRILFASELKSILEDDTVGRTIDREALHHYLVFGRVPAPFSIFEGISKLPPAHMAVIEGGKTDIRKYWQLSFRQKLDLGEEDLKTELLRRFESAVKDQMVSDVPLGVFLSGGVDSSAVAVMMARHSEKPIETFSVGFNEKDYSELAYAKKVASILGANHHEFIIEPDVLGILPKLVWHMDEPFADASIIPAYYVSKASRDYVTVALTGDGSDELFAGYEWYKALKIAYTYALIPRNLRRMMRLMADLIKDNDEREKFVRYLHKAKRLIETQADTDRDPMAIFMRMNTGFCDDDLFKGLYSKDFAKEQEGLSSLEERRKSAQEYDGKDILESLLFAQFSTLLPDMFFAKTDRMSMSVSLETRAPFMDHKFIEFCAKIPFKFKLNGMKTKYILKRSLEGILPRDILYRHKKGFSIPVARWSREGRLKEDIMGALLGKSSLLKDYFDENHISLLVKEHMEGKRDHFNKLWRLYMLVLWEKEFLVRN